MNSPVLDVPIETKGEKAAVRPDLWNIYAKAGVGSASENTLIEQNLPLVKTVVGRMAMTLPSHVNQDDLYSAGLVGLLSAVRRFDQTCRCSFEHYARTRIRGAILDELRRLDWVPRSVHEKAKKVAKAMRELSQTKGRIPTDDEMAQALQISPRQYEELLEQIRPASYVSLDSIQDDTGENENGASHEIVADDGEIDPAENTARRELAQLMEKRIQELPEMQRKVLALYYKEDLRLREIAEVFGVSESRICQIHTKAIIALKALLQDEDPDAFSHS